MLQNWLFLLPETFLLTFLPVAALVNRYRADKTPKTFFTLSKYCLIAAMISTIVFYNQSPLPKLWQNTAFTALFKIVIYLVGLAWFYLSSKWFLAKNKMSLVFYVYAMLAVLGMDLLLSAATFALPAVIVPFLCFLIWRMLHLMTDEEDVAEVSRLYAFWSCFFCLLLWGGIFLFWNQLHDLSFEGIKAFLSRPHVIALWEYAAVTLIMAALLFMMAAAPFHSWLVDVITLAVLPVGGLLTVLLPFVCLACLISLMCGVFLSLADFMQPVLLFFGVVSLIVGALSANGETNLRRLFAFSTVYNLGFMLFGIVSFKTVALLGAFAYTVIYVLSMAGIYTVFLGLKSRGNYLVCVDDIGGLSEVKPYLSAALLIFMFSLIGVPPFLGFVGRLSVINNLIVDERWLHVVLLMLSLLFMANAYLQVIRKIYFSPLKNSFDRTDKAIYICLFINLILVVISLLNPGYLLHDAELVLSGAF